MIELYLCIGVCSESIRRIYHIHGYNSFLLMIITEAVVPVKPLLRNINYKGE